jgi:hypothetical protein
MANSGLLPIELLLMGNDVEGLVNPRELTYDHHLVVSQGYLYILIKLPYTFLDL